MRKESHKNRDIQISDEKASDFIRGLCVSMVEKAQSGHPGGAMGGADFIYILYKEFLNFYPSKMEWHLRDRFFMDAGHLSSLLYAQLYLLGFYSKEDIENFRQWKSVTPGHPEIDLSRGIENTSGPLGQGHAMAVGAAIAAKFLNNRFPGWFDHKIYTYISDGGIQEEISQGVGRIAGHLGLNNLIMFYDSNDIQLSSTTSEVTSENTKLKYESWGWSVINIDGHDHDQIRKALKTACSEKDKPTLIIGKTVIGKGCVDSQEKSYEGECDLHGQPISKTKADLNNTLVNLGIDPDKPFDIPDELKITYLKILTSKEVSASTKDLDYKFWLKENPDEEKKIELFFNDSYSSLNFSEILHKENISTREASGNVLSFLAGKVENIIVASADLSNSDKTDSFLKRTSILRKKDFSGKFLQVGVSEFTMAALANGMALHGGVRPIVATFFVFSDYMKPAIRLSAIQQLPVIYVWTHDSFRVGEDGPTHQPIEQEMQIRLLEKIKNHSGEMSFLALRPANSAETSVAWEMALKNLSSPTGLILSRQNIKDGFQELELNYNDLINAKKGAYFIRKQPSAQINLIANGSEVSTLIEASQILEKEEDLRCNIISIISEGLFKKQSINYQKSIISEGGFVYGLTAGLPVNLENLVGNKGYVQGLETFGYSATASVLDQKFEFTPKQVAMNILEHYRKYHNEK